MAKFRMVYTEFWTDPNVIEEMTPEDKYFFLYILTNPNTTQIGVYEITKKQAAFDMGYSLESVNALFDRFINHHKLMQYNETTRELAIKNWGKFNLTRGGKPMLDCIKAELPVVKDVSLIEYVAQGVPRQDIKSIYESYYDTSTPREEEQEDREEQQDKDEDTTIEQPTTAPHKEIVKFYNSTCISFNPVKQITAKRKGNMNARYRENNCDIEVFKTVFTNMQNSSFLKGGWDSGGKADFDWVLRPTNFVKVLEGKYSSGSDKSKQQAPKPTVKPTTFNRGGQGRDWDFTEMERLERERMKKMLGDIS